MPKVLEFDRSQLIGALQDFNKNVMPESKLRIHTDNEEQKEANKVTLRDSVTAIESCAFALVNDGLNPENGTIMDTKTIDKTLGLVADAAGIGSTAILTQQVLTRSLQHLDVPTPIHQHFSTKMAFKTGTQTVIPYIGSATGARDIGPGQELPMISLDRDSEVISSTGRSGIGITLPDETMRNSNYPILALYMQKANEALAVWKDKKAVRTLLAESVALFDNALPSASVYGRTSGRSRVDGTLNGTFTLRDIHKMYQKLMQDGYNADTILISQWGYLLFMYEPILRQFLEFNNGVMFTTPKGTIGNRARNEAAQRSRETTPANAHQNLAPAMEIPNALTGTNFNVIVTNHMPTYFEGDVLYKELERSLSTDNTEYEWDNNNVVADTATSAVANCKGPSKAVGVSGEIMHCGPNPMTDVVMCDSYNALLYLEEEKPKVDKKYDNLYESLEIYIRERYAFVTLEKGRAIVSARNVVITEDTHDYAYRASNTAEEMRKALAVGTVPTTPAP